MLTITQIILTAQLQCKYCDQRVCWYVWLLTPQ